MNYWKKIFLILMGSVLLSNCAGKSHPMPMYESEKLNEHEVESLTLSAKQGDEKAARILIAYYLVYKNDFKSTISLYEMLYSKGDISAALELGKYYSEGKPPKNFEKAKKMLTIVIKSNSAYKNAAQRRLDELNEKMK